MSQLEQSLSTLVSGPMRTSNVPSSVALFLLGRSPSVVLSQFSGPGRRGHCPSGQLSQCLEGEDLDQVLSSFFS